MDRDEKLLLSASEAYGHTFRQGLFVRMYEQNLFWFSTHIKPLKPMLERVKGGEPVVYGGLPVASFEKILEEHALCAEALTILQDSKIGNGSIATRPRRREAQDVPSQIGWKWRYAEQDNGTDKDFSVFAAWRGTLIVVAVPQHSDYGSA